MNIRKDYPGGNIKVISVDGNVVKLAQELRDTAPWWFYWNFCVENPPREEITFEFMNRDVVGFCGPAVSFDGEIWTRIGESCFRGHNSFVYQFDGTAKRVYFCFSFPYLMKDFDRFYSRHCRLPSLRRLELTKSKKGTPIPLLTFGNGKAGKDIVFACRTHACESTASYLLEGLLDYLFLHAESPIFENFRFHVIPLVDVDGVENGDQGKFRAPLDHDSDYCDTPIHNSTKAIMKYVRELNLIVGIDFHSPGMWGPGSDYPFFAKDISPFTGEIAKLAAILHHITKSRPGNDKIIFEVGNDLEPNQGWNKANQANLGNFFCKQNAKIACTFEFPYFGPKGMVFNQANMRLLGEDFAKSLGKYLA
jgi:hypothetical protein